MHELSLATSLIEQAQTIAQRENATTIKTITVEIGALSGVMADALTFCFPDAAQGTMLQNTTLNILHVPVVAKCNSCGHSFSQSQTQLPTFNLACPQCNCGNVTILSGKDFRLKDMEII